MSRIKFNFDADEADNAVLYLLEKFGGELEILKLAKLLFFADFRHFVRHGRPITSDEYYALPRGPVPTKIYDRLKTTGDSFARSGNWVVALRKSDRDYLSETDKATIDNVVSEMGELSGQQLEDKSHQYELWKKNYPGGKTSALIPYEDFFLDAKDREGMIEILHEDQEARDLLNALV
jgi:uncharacterized phage-associated protein